MYRPGPRSADARADPFDVDGALTPSIGAKVPSTPLGEGSPNPDDGLSSGAVFALRGRAYSVEPDAASGDSGSAARRMRSMSVAEGVTLPEV
jgi:hypothetical protein